MKILLITQWFEPEPTLKGLAFAKALSERGHDVQVITGFPNYPGGKVYDGYQVRAAQREWHGRVEVCRVALYPSHDSSCLFGVFASRKADVIYAYHPPLTVGMSAALIGLFRRTPVVYDIQDMWPDTLKATGMLNNPRALSLIGRICQWVYRRASALVVLSPGFKKLLQERGVPEEKISVIYNWCDEAALTALVAEKNQEVQFVFVGGGVDVDRLKSLAKQKSPSNVVFLPRMPMHEVGNVLSGADVLLVHLRDDPLFKVTVPSKTQAYMAVGKPILMAVRGDAATLVERAKCGLSVDPESSVEIARAVIAMSELRADELERMGGNGLDFYKNNLSLNAGVNEFIRVLNSVIK